MASSHSLFFRPRTDLPCSLGNDPTGLDLGQDVKMTEMTQEERENALYDLHGVSDPVKETDELVTLKLDELDMELERVTKAPAFQMVVKQSIDYVKKMRLAFLRADLFDAKKAAQRMVRYFEYKLYTFGESTLGRDIIWDDLTEREQMWLQKGSIQLLPQRDRSGRAVLIRIGKYNLQESCMTQLRLNFFFHSIVVKDEEIQKNGVVWIQYSVGLKKFSPESATAISTSPYAIPVRRVATHLCYDNPLLHPVAKLLELVTNRFDARDVPRLRVHFGSHMECIYNLMTFGITKESIPVSPSGRMRLSFHLQWLKQIQNKPCALEENRLAVVALVPGPMDVVLGRGRHGTNAPGNVRFKLMLQEKKECYDNAEKGKGEIIRTMMKELKDSGTRFVKREGQGWAEVPDADVRVKIAKAFRNLRADVGSSNTSMALSKKPRT